jgi:dimethylaniline monooxygenase (N-oxide forming)
MSVSPFPHAPNPRVCIIGAGSSGIATAKVLHERRIAFDCFELSDRVGGNWVWANKNGVSAAYKSLHMITSRQHTAFSDFPMSDNLPNFPRHDQVAAYFDAYVDHFGFRDKITFETGVRHVDRCANKAFEVSLTTGEVRQYDAVCIANGHHWDPHWPDPGFRGAETFTGEQMHSRDYKEGAHLAGKTVVVLGMGNSAMDIAVDASYHAAKTYLAHRRGAHIIPKYLFGRPYDQLAAGGRGPAWLGLAVAGAVVKLATGSMSSYGLQKPDHKFGSTHPTVSGHILDRLAHGAVTSKPNIDHFEIDDVVFTDGSRVKADLVVYCTGYKISFPFFDKDFLAAPDNEIRLYQRLFQPNIPGLYFIGLIQPLGAIMPIAERQSELVADHLSGVYALPSIAEMDSEIAMHRRSVAKHYVKSNRHTIEVDMAVYMRELTLERAKGAERARLATGGIDQSHTSSRLLGRRR